MSLANSTTRNPSSGPITPEFRWPLGSMYRCSESAMSLPHRIQWINPWCTPVGLVPSDILGELS